MPTALLEGQTAAVWMTVDEAMTAARFAKDAGEAYPSVLATPFLIAEMERACAGLMIPALEPGQLSVGAKIDMSHQAPTPVGARVTTCAKFVSQAGPLFWFDVWAEDPGGIVARGKHARAIVEREGIERRAAERAASGSGAR